MLLREHIDPAEVGSLNRLAIVGDAGMGALCYRPEIPFGSALAEIGLDRLAAECAKILKTAYSEDLDLLFRLGGSSGGARPKIFQIRNRSENRTERK